MWGKVLKTGQNWCFLLSHLGCFSGFLSPYALACRGGRLLCCQSYRDANQENGNTAQYSKATVPLKVTTDHQVLPHIHIAKQLQNAKKEYSIATSDPWSFATYILLLEV